jgi:type VI secretion system protein ImpC
MTRVDPARIDALVADIDRRVANQLDAILHHPRFQELESAWRALRALVDRVSFNENTRVEVLNCSKEDLLLDFEDAPSTEKSGLFKIVYAAEYGPFGGRPYVVLITLYDIAATREDVDVVARCGKVADLAHLVFLASAHPSLAGRPSAAALAADGPAELATDAVARAWLAFRNSPGARYVGLTFPRCLARAPHAQVAVGDALYSETIAKRTDLVWHSAAVALAACIARSFALWRVTANITGPECGRVDELPSSPGPDQPGSLEAVVSPARVEALAEAGIIALSPGGAGEAYFDSAMSCLADSAAIPAAVAPADRRLHRLLPATFFIARFAQYLKIVQREQIGAWQEIDELRSQMTRLVNEWVLEHPALSAKGEELAEMVAADPGDHEKHLVFQDYLLERGHAGAQWLRSRHPLRWANLRVEPPTREHPGRRSFELRIEPNWGYDGRFFQLALTGVFDLE